MEEATPPAIDPPDARALREVGRTPESTHESSDDTLLLDLLANDREAWKLFVQRMQDLVRRVAARTAASVGARMGSEEILNVEQEVWLRLLTDDFRRLRMYRSTKGASLASWVRIVTSSTTRDFVRSKRRQQLDMRPSWDFDLMHSQAPGPHECAVANDQRRAVERNLSALPPRDREFVVRYFAENRDPDEVAAMMSIEVSTVYSKKAKIIRRLTEQLDEDF